MSGGVFVVRQNAENPVIFVDIFIFDKFKSRDSPFLANLGFLEAVFLQPLFLYNELRPKREAALLPKRKKVGRMF